MSDNAPIISLDHVACRYRIKRGFMGKHYYQALNDITIDFHEGETHGIIGRNGAGKSTLLRLIAGIILPDSGSITYKPRLSVSLLSLQLGFSKDLTGRDNAIMGAMMLGYSKPDAIARLPSIIDFSELGDWIDEPTGTYSTGMKARLGFAVAMETSPDVLLIDEVLGVGDENFRKKSVRVMKEKMKSGQSVIFVSHSLETVKELCTRITWIENGRTQLTGDPKKVAVAYKNGLKSMETGGAPLPAPNNA